MAELIPALVTGALGSGLVPKIVNFAAPILKKVLPEQLVDTGAELIKGIADMFGSPDGGSAPSPAALPPPKGMYEAPPPAAASVLNEVGAKMESPAHVSGPLMTPAGRVMLPSPLGASNLRSVVIPNMAQMRVAKTLSRPRRKQRKEGARPAKRRVRRYFN